MRTTIDAAGRLVIPKAIRTAAGLRPGMALDISVEDGTIEIEPAPMRIRLERRGHFVVAVPEDDLPTVTADELERVREELLLERERRILGL